MNWTASLLRNQLNKERLEHETRINVLTNSSIDTQNFLALEERIKVLEWSLENSESFLSIAKKELENQTELSAKELKAKESQLTKLAKKITTSKELIFKLNKQLRDNQLYYQRELRKVKETYQAKLTPLHQQIKDLKAVLSLNNSEKDEKLIAQQTKITNLQTELSETANSLTVAQQELSTTTQNSNLSQQLTILITQKDQAQLPFEEIETIIKANKILLFPIKKKLKERVKEIKTAFHWGEVAQDWDLGDSRSPTPLTESEKPISSKKSKKSLNWRTHGVPFLDFAEELTQQWLNQGFTKIQCQEWLNIGMKATDANFCAWLRDSKQKDAEWMLNHGNSEELKQEFETYDRK